MPNRFLTLGCPSYHKAAKLVGYIQITFGASLILLMIYFGTAARLVSPQVSGIPEGFWIFSIPTSALAACSMCMGFLLLDAIYHKGLFQCRIWLVIITIFLFVSVIGFSTALETEELIPLQLKAIMTLGMCLVIYMANVVASYYKTLKSELANIYPGPKNNNNANNVTAIVSGDTDGHDGIITLKIDIDEPWNNSKIYTISSPNL